MLRSIDLSTVAAFLEHGHQLIARCASCQRWGVVDLERMVRDGRGDHLVHRVRAICRQCGGVGVRQVRGSTPRWNPFGPPTLADSARVTSLAEFRFLRDQHESRPRPTPQLLWPPQQSAAQVVALDDHRARFPARRAARAKARRG